MSDIKRKRVHLVCGGRYHDFDFARLELLKLLAELEHVRVTVSGDFSNEESLHASDALITYTSDLLPDESQQDGLQQFLREGGRWFALHGSNSSLRYNKQNKWWEAPNRAPRYFSMLGSQFLAHPPIQDFKVRACSKHPLVAGIEPFVADDEIYLCRFEGEHQVLLETQFSGMAPGFEAYDWQDNKQVPIMYLHPWEDNEILYFNLGHARGHYDMLPISDYYTEIERGSWKQPAFYELLRRGIRWSLGELQPASITRGRAASASAPTGEHQ